MELEIRSYFKFQTHFFLGEFGNQRYGQAFYDYFKLYEVSNQEQFENLYECTYEEAKVIIDKIFIFH